MSDSLGNRIFEGAILAALIPVPEISSMCRISLWLCLEFTENKVAAIGLILIKRFDIFDG